MPYTSFTVHHDALHLWSKEGAGTSSPTSRSPWVLGFIPTVHLGIAPSLVAFEPCALYPSDSLNHKLSHTATPPHSILLLSRCYPGVGPHKVAAPHAQHTRLMDPCPWATRPQCVDELPRVVADKSLFLGSDRMRSANPASSLTGGSSAVLGAQTVHLSFPHFQSSCTVSSHLPASRNHVEIPWSPDAHNMHGGDGDANFPMCGLSLPTGPISDQIKRRRTAKDSEGGEVRCCDAAKVDKSRHLAE